MTFRLVQKTLRAQLENEIRRLREDGQRRLEEEAEKARLAARASRVCVSVANRLLERRFLLIVRAVLERG